VYEDAAIKPANRAAVKLIRDSGVLERIADWTNKALLLRHDVVMKVSDKMPKGVLSPIAEPDGNTILIPASFFAENHAVLVGFVKDVNRTGGLPKIVPKDKFNAGVLTVWAEEYVIAHEMGHALMHQLQLPITGLEELSADGFATFFTIHDDKVGGGTDPSIGAAILFDELQRMQGNPTAADYSSDHPITKQRVYNFLCFAAGSDPKVGKTLVAGRYLPKDRALVCPLEWAQLNLGWWQTLEPHLTQTFSRTTAAARGQAREKLTTENTALAELIKKLRGTTVGHGVFAPGQAPRAATP
jgi:hypothetical protein